MFCHQTSLSRWKTKMKKHGKELSQEKVTPTPQFLTLFFGFTFPPGRACPRSLVLWLHPQFFSTPTGLFSHQTLRSLPLAA